MKPGDTVTVRSGSRSRPYFKTIVDTAEDINVPAWLSRDLKNLSGTVIRLPERGEMDSNLQEQLIVEYYSR
jgi:small subunit ribosomal protein S4